jgi:hypothetical protein
MRRWDWSTAVLLIASLLLLSVGLRERALLQDALSKMASLWEETRDLAVYRNALLWDLNQVSLDPPFLVAETDLEVQSTPVVHVQEPSNVVLYFLSPDCPICPTNYDFLNMLAEDGATVFGLAFEPVEREVELHKNKWELRFPVLANPTGSAVDLIPRYGTPTTVVFSQGKVVLLEFGELEPETREFIRSLVQSWPKVLRR